MSMPLPTVDDSICRLDESALTSTRSDVPSVSSVLPSVDSLPSVSSVVLHSLLLGKGMDRLLQIFTCGLPCRWLKAVWLQLMGSLGGSEYEAVPVWPSRELGLSASNSSSGLGRWD